MDVVSLERQHKRGPLWRFLAGVVDIALLVILALFLVQFVARPVSMKGHSMEPVIEADGLMLVDRVWYRFTSPKQFDVIAFQTEQSSELQVKRVIAVPGDRIRITNGKIYINNELCSEADEYIYGLTSAGLAQSEITVGPGEYFVLGDNAAYSEDSRFSDIGLVQADQIEGKVWFSASSIVSFRLV